MRSRYALPLEERPEDAFRQLGADVQMLKQRGAWVETGCAVTCYIGTITGSYTSGDPSVLLPTGATIGPCRYVTTYTPTANATVLLVPVGQSYIVVGALA